MNNPFSTLTKKEWLLWLCSLFIVLVSNILAANFDPLTLIAALVGVTSLVFAAKRQRLGAGADDRVQYFIRYHLLPVPLLG